LCSLHQRVARRARLCILACGVREVETLIRHFENMLEVTFEKLPHVDVLGGNSCAKSACSEVQVCGCARVIT
jgi:hypothetical protein